MSEEVLEIVMKKDVKFNEPVAVEGFPDVGLAGAIASMHLIESLGLEEIAYIETPLLPPIMVVHNGELLHPIRVYGNERLIVFTSEIALPLTVLNPLVKKVVEWLKSLNAKLLIALTGIPVENRLEIERPEVYAVVSKKEYSEMLSKHKIEVLQEGFISGIYALFLKECLKAGLPAIALVAQSFLKYPDPGAAAELLTSLNSILSLNVDVKPLLENAEEIRLKARDLLRQTERVAPGAYRNVEGELPLMYR
ncbi:MAG: proteasome assembly chaperone family protein [Nitrososphaeria archaeon]|nr:proteasome assembly chaperone family protein [Nitrososphaeria archaeon]